MMGIGRRLCQAVKSCMAALELKRNVISFFIFGVTGNFAFAISLSAAQDILEDNPEDTTNSSRWLDRDASHGNASHVYHSQGHETTEYLICNQIGTGAVLLSAILPELFVKMAVQFTAKQMPYYVKLILTTFFTVSSLLIIAFAEEVWLRILGVSAASVAIGIGELTFLPLTVFYDKSVVSSWSSGTGASALLGSLLYAGLISLGVSTSTFMLMVLVAPAIMVLTYAFLLKPEVVKSMETEPSENTDIIDDTIKEDPLTLKEKTKRLPSLLRYLLPLCLVYFTVYFINQGLHELLYLNNQSISRSSQYRWFQAIYRSGAFVSRSAVSIVQVKNTWIVPLMLFASICIFVCQIFFHYIPYLWIIMVLIFTEGVLNGVAYVNTFYCMTNELGSDIKEFALGVVTLAGPIGITLAGAVAVPFHNYICTLDLKM